MKYKDNLDNVTIVDEKIEERKNNIIAFLKHKDYQPMKIKELVHMLHVPSGDRAEFEEILGGLIAEGKVIRTKRGKFAAPETFNLIAGTFQGHPKGFGFLIPDDPTQKDIFIPANGVNGAMHHDRIMCKIIYPATESRRAEAEVIEILKRGPSKIVGRYEESDHFGFVIPDDKRYSRDIFIPKKMSMGAVTGHKVLVEITDWAEERRNPDGKVVGIIGHINDPGVDILSIIYQYDLPLEFPEEVMNEVGNVPDEVLEKDKKGREDLRHIPMVTIDGEDAKDLDDAISLEQLDNGRYRLGVHIADVTHYVKEGSALDKEAYRRGTSVYLVDRVIPMLPHKLSNGICSLNAGVDRLALTCMMDVDQSGNVFNHRIVETLINIDERMSYTDVKKILVDEDQELISRYKEYIDMFKAMEELAIILRKKRTQRGSIDFDFEESKVIVDENGKVIDIKAYDRNIATRIIEEFMLLSNETIAEDYYWQDRPFIYRSHEEPDPEKIEKLSTFIYNFGYRIKGANTKIHPKNLQTILADIEDKPEENIISRLVLRSMKQARYTPECDGHFGLAAKYYCHFTSPIRRYPDLQIHRIIKYNLNNKLEGKLEKRLLKLMPSVAKQCSVRERVAEEADRETVQLKKVEYMTQFIGKLYKGVITGITSWGVYVELPNTVEGLVHVTEMDDDYYIHDDVHHQFIGERTKKTYRLGDETYVRLVKTSIDNRTIDFSFVSEEEAKEEAAHEGYEL